MKKTILFVVNILNYDIHNRKSAIDSILYSVLEQLSTDYIIYVNDEKFEKSKDQRSNIVYNLSNSNSFKKYIPVSIKINYNDYKSLKSNNKLFKKITEHIKPDIIIELMRYGSELGILLKKHYNVPLIVYFDAPSVEERRFFYPGLSFFDKQANKNEEKTIEIADQIIVYTQPIIDYWIKRLPNVNLNKFNIFQTLDYTRLDFVTEKKQNNIPVIGFIGSFLKWHRIDLLINVFDKIRREGVEAKLLLIGAGEEYQKIKGQSLQSEYKEDIELTGFVDGEKLKDYRNKIDIGVMSGTHWYCMPTKVFEYGAAQISSIAPRTDNMKFLFKEDEHLLMFEQFNESELYTALKTLLLDFNKRKQLGTNLQLVVKEKNSSVVAKQFYDNLIKNSF